MEQYQIATTLGYGPRFLHSTGQLHKGGPNNGLFLQIVASHDNDIAIPGGPFTFALWQMPRHREISRLCTSLVGGWSDYISRMETRLCCGLHLQGNSLQQLESR